MPAHIFDPECIAYCCSDFRNFIEDDEAYGVTPDLSNKVLRLFARAKFSNLDDGQYEALKPALQLASRMLRDQRAQKFVVTTIDGTLHDDHPKGEVPGPERTWADIDAREAASGACNTRLLRYPPTATASRIRRRATRVLWHLANCLQRIDLDDIIDDGTCTMDPSESISAISRSTFPRSGRAVIVLRRRQVPPAFSSDNALLDELMHHYATALTVVHEVGHLLNQAVNGVREEEVFHGDSCCDEAGFALEEALFGGIADVHNLGEQWTEHDHDELAMVSVSYPNPEICQRYTSAEGVLLIAQRWKLETWITNTRIPWSFVAGMFTERFWREQVLLWSARFSHRSGNAFVGLRR